MNENEMIQELTLGEIVIPQYKSCDQSYARKYASDLGIEAFLNMPRCGLRNILVKAVKSANQKFKSDYDVVQVHEGPNKVQYTVVRKEINNRGQDYEGNEIRDPNVGVEARFYFSKKNRDDHKPANECLNFFSNPNHTVSQFINSEYYNQAVVFTADDMRRSANNMLFALGSVQITRGNAWFTPRQQKEATDKLSAWLCGNKCYMSRYTQLDVNETKRSLSKDCKRGLEANLESLKDMITKHKMESKTRETTLQKRIDDLNKLQVTCNLYTSAIGANLDDLKDEISSCEKDLVDFMLSAKE